MLITNGKLITWETPNRLLEGYGILIRDGKIAEVAPLVDLIEKYPEDEKLDAGGQLVMPGNICAHTHFYGAYARGMAIPGTAPADFPEILSKLWWPLDQALDETSIRHSALVCLVDAIKNGTTTLIDHHASPNAIDGSLDVIADTVLQAGLRASLCYEVTDRGGVDKMKQGIRENVRFGHRIASGDHHNHHLAATFGIHASLTVSDDTLNLCRESVPENVGFHIHVAEHSVDEYDSLNKSGLRVIDRLYQFGILGNRTIAVHAVHVDPKEISLLAETGTWVTHQPRSNMNNGVGIGDVEGMLHAGIKVCLGNDGFSNAMWDEWSAAYLAHKLWHRDPRRMSGEKVAQLAAYHNAELASQQFDTPIGALVPGAAADLIFVDYHPYTPITSGNIPWHIIFGFQSGMVNGTMVDGRLLMWKRELLTFDEDKIFADALAYAPAVWKKYQTAQG